MANTDEELRDEVWKTVPDFEGVYEVSNYGRVRSVDRTVECDYYDRWGNHVTERQMPGRMLSERVQSAGYVQYELHDGSGMNETVLRLAHRMVMEAFGPEPPSVEHTQVNHLDGDCSNNHISNLEWSTPQENELHSKVHALICEKGPIGSRGKETRPWSQNPQFSDGTKITFCSVLEAWLIPLKNTTTSLQMQPDEIQRVDDEESAPKVQGLPFNAPEDSSSSINSDQMLVRRWLAEKSPGTQEEYARDLEQFVNFVDLPLRSVTLGHLQDYRKHLKDQGYAKSTQKRKLSSVKSIFTFGTKLRYFAHNVGAAVSTPRARDSRADRILSESDLWAILRDEKDLRNHVLLRLFYASGGRVSDVEGLRWRDLKDRPNLEGPDGRPGGQVTFYGKGDKTRAVTLYSKVWSLIVRLRTEEKAKGHGASDDPVFRSQKGGSLSRTQIWRIVKKAATRAGVKLTEKTRSDGVVKRDENGDPIITSEVSPHWFRHAHASHALQKGADLELVRETLGHESIETTKTYLHAQPGKSSSYYVDDAPDFDG